MNKYLVTVPFDLYDLHIFELVARSGSFSKAARQGGLTQSAITRIIQRMELRLGAALFERTTRHVKLSPAGELLLDRGRSLTRQISELQEDLQLATKPPSSIQVGIERTIGLAYLPGFFHCFQKAAPGIAINLLQDSGPRLLELLIERELDILIIPRPNKLPPGTEAAHCFSDDFSFIISSTTPWPSGSLRKRDLKKPPSEFRWLLLSRSTPTGRDLWRWLKQFGFDQEIAVESENIELLINMVALGMGVSIVPTRAVALYLQRDQIRKIPMHPRFSREIIVLPRKSSIQRPHIKTFVDSILF